ncbi:MAG TPA: TaqI-like C-terminal specificity domain-containing protein, partial [Clostridiales bacterium]|nr:TaqI-like C-terminal specificity domain-containing protein [Clostridiales bacterium]
FLLDGIRRLNGKGVYCWIVPNKLLVSQYAMPVLEYLKENGLRYTISVSDLNVFSGVGVYPVIVTGNRCEAGKKEIIGTRTRNDAGSCRASVHSDSCCIYTNCSDPGKTGCTGVGSTDEFGVCGTDRYSSHDGLLEYAADSLQQLETRRFFSRSKTRQYETFADHNIKIASGAAGFQAAVLKECIIEAQRAADATLREEHPMSDGCGNAIPFAVSGSIDRYCLDRSKVRYMGTIYENPYILKGEKIADSKWKLWCSEKICIAGMTKELEAYYSREPLAIGVGTYAIYGFGGTDPFYLLALLNSRFMSWYLREKFYERHLAGGYIAVNKFMLEQLPLVRTDKKTEQELARRAEKLQQNFCGGAMAEKLLSEIDEMVCMIYGLDGKETDRIRNAALG